MGVGSQGAGSATRGERPADDQYVHAPSHYNGGSEQYCLGFLKIKVHLFSFTVHD